MIEKNILVITGSPRINGNSELLSKSFANGAVEVGHKVKFFHTGRKNIGGCKACEKCQTSMQTCVILDDFIEVDSLIREADVIVFATPVYWYGMTSQLKAFIDRLYVYISPLNQDALKIKEYVLLACGADVSESMFLSLVSQFEDISQFMNWNCIGTVLAKNIYNKGEIEQSEVMAIAKTLGRSL